MAQIKELVSGERLDQDLKMGNGEGSLSCLFGYGKQTVPTIAASSTISLVVGKAGTDQVQLKANMLLLTSSDDTSSVLRLPPAADWAGVPLVLVNTTAGFDLVVKDSTGGTTIVTLTEASGGGATKPEAVVISTGTTINIID
tara:strand:- start:141 stop:566 length:426 start_codon:yes stop_codon:yes gene_type:complete